MIKTLKNFHDYAIPWRGHPGRDRVDNDFSWVLMAHVELVGRDDHEPDYEISASGFRTVTLKVSRPTQEAATEELHAAMLQLVHGGSQ
jgi:hypothetical protein